ncbi:MAG: response regulator [Candidatus Omnitrophica bacterium]|nr:response regulator [Candidatus Omnitrophota bacterium]MDD5573672.1 response regulator [Candidatus Omnitrophota bacterium]
MNTKKKILVIDDEADIREIVRIYLEEEGCEVLEASNGQEGILKAQSEKPDLIVLDIMLPGINGFEVAKHLKDDPNTQDIPVIILSVLAQDSQYRQGILDYISKPFRQEELVATVRRIFSKVNGKGQKKTILVVDDDPDIVDIIAICLKDNNLSPEKAYNGQEALEKVKSGNINLILLDINMPGMNGFEVIKHLKGDPKTCDIPVVVLTGTYISDDDKRHGLTLGVAKYLTKPFSADDLVKEIKGSLHA